MIYIHDPYKILSENVASMLGELADHFENAKDGIRSLSIDYNWRTRKNALIALGSHNLSSIHEPILKAALSDRSTEVRTFAASKAVIFCLQQLLLELESAIQVEKNPKTKRELEWCRDHLQQQANSTK